MKQLHRPFSPGQMPMNLIKVEELMNNQIQSPHNAVFLAIDKKTKKAIGFAGLYDIHLTAHKAEFRVLIGEKEVWNKGYGTEITELLTYYGFDRLNLHRVWLGVLLDAIDAFNQKAISVKAVQHNAALALVFACGNDHVVTFANLVHDRVLDCRFKEPREPARRSS